MKNQNNTDPLELLLEKYNFNLRKINKLTTGAKYTAILLKNGNIGVCANLGHKIISQIDKYLNIDLNNFSHRIVLNAYFNALLNYDDEFCKSGDIFEKINFRKYKHIIMIGLFKPIVKKFQENNIPLTVFDYRKSETLITSNSKQRQHLQEADTVILTATSIFNLTFLNITNNTGDNCEIFMLGPSSIMIKEILQYRNIKMIFGSTFKKFDDRVLEIIRNNGGTREFLKYGEKRIFKIGEIDENLS
ncbi:MAG: hypothetical protein KAU01_09640 [Candidatus Cloacimonetes bacterium]|nr:hypothetical protein [Candidatus Cloacimonadota bacterium]